MPNNNVQLVNFDSDGIPDSVHLECKPRSEFFPEEIECTYDVYLSTCGAENGISVPFETGKAPIKCGLFNAYYNGDDTDLEIDAQGNVAPVWNYLDSAYFGCQLFVDDSHIELRCLNRDDMCVEGRKNLLYETLLMQGF